MNVITHADADFSDGKDRILKGICEKLQLSRTQYASAEAHYRAVGEWLEKEDSILAPHNPQIYPQGSLPMDVTNKPLQQDEYDLDFICELQLPHWMTSPADLFSKFEFRIRQHGDYRKRMELGNRCIRLTYAHDFHLDIVPACANEVEGWGQVKIPDRDRQSWKDSNSRRYVNWFNAIADRSQDVPSRVDHAEPLPQAESFDEKSALKFAVQLLKRCRDIAFESNPDLAPASIVLSTLAAKVYQGSPSVFWTVAHVLDSIAALIKLHNGQRLRVQNPANQVYEDLGERWEQNPEAYEAFKDWICSFQEAWNSLKYAGGYGDISNILVSLFGEMPTRDAIREDADWVAKGRESGVLGITGSGLLTTQTPAIAIPRNTFYGG